MLSCSHSIRIPRKLDAHRVLPNQWQRPVLFHGGFMAQNKKLLRDLTVGNTALTLYRLAIPVMISNLLQTIYNMADMMIVGRFEGSTGLSAVSVGGDVMHLYTFIGMGFATAGQIIVSQYIGANKRRELNEVIGTMFSFLVISGLGLMLISILSLDPFLRILNVPALSYAGARAYVICCSFGLVFIFGYNAVSAILRGMGDSRHPMIFIGYAAIMNIILDLLFVGYFRIGPAGAAIATVLAQGTSLILALSYLYRNKEQFCFDFRRSSFRIVPDNMKKILKLGIPIAIQTSAASISTLFVSSHVNTYGVAASAITGAGAKLSSIALIVANALNTSGASIIGQSFGAGKPDRVRRVFFTDFFTVLAFTSLLSLWIMAVPEMVFGLFASDPDVLAMSHLYAPVAAITFLGFSVRSPSLALINGLGQSRINFIMGIAEGFILRIGLTILLGSILGFGLQGYWYGSAIASYGYGMVVFPYFFSGRWRNLKRLSD